MVSLFKKLTRSANGEMSEGTRVPRRRESKLGEGRCQIRTKIVYNENFRTFEIELQERAEEEGRSNWLDRFMLWMWGPSTWRSRHLRSDKWETGTEEIPFE